VLRVPDQINKYIDPLKTRWNSLTRPQQYKLVGVVLFVILAIILAAFFAFRTRWFTLVANQDFMTTSRMVTALNQSGYRNRMTSDGSGIQVDFRDRFSAMNAIHHAEAAPDNDIFTWEMAFDTGLGTTETERNARENLALEGQITSLLMGYNGIVSARVILAVPDPRPFDRNANPPSANVLLHTNRTIPPHEGRAMALGVAQSVQGLTLDNITITDQNLRIIFAGELDTTGDPVGSAHEARIMFQNRTEASALALLSQFYGGVSAAFNFSFDDRLFSEEITTEFNTPVGHDTGIPSHMRTERAEMEGIGGGFSPGLGANAQALAGYMMGDDNAMSASQRSEFTDFHVNESQRITQLGPGWVIPENSTAAVTLTRHVPIHQELWMQEEDGRTQSDWDRFVAENSSAVNLGTSYENFDEIRTLIAGAGNIPIENVQLMVWEQMIHINAEQADWDIPLFIMIAVLILLLAMLIYGLLRKQKQAEEEAEDLEPELSVEDLLVSTQLEEAKEEAAEELEAIEYFKDNEVKRQIEKFVNEKPEAVASLLRNWINLEEW